MGYKWGLSKWTARNTLPIGVNVIGKALLTVDSIVLRGNPEAEAE
jgi:hypothetical protein